MVYVKSFEFAAAADGFDLAGVYVGQFEFFKDGGVVLNDAG